MNIDRNNPIIVRKLPFLHFIKFEYSVYSVSIKRFSFTLHTLLRLFWRWAEEYIHSVVLRTACSTNKKKNKGPDWTQSICCYFRIPAVLHLSPPVHSWVPRYLGTRYGVQDLLSHRQFIRVWGWIPDRQYRAAVFFPTWPDLTRLATASLLFRSSIVSIDWLWRLFLWNLPKVSTTVRYLRNTL